MYNDKFVSSYKIARNVVISNCDSSLNCFHSNLLIYGPNNLQNRSYLSNFFNSFFKLLKIIQFESALKRDDFETCITLYFSEDFKDIRDIIDEELEKLNRIAPNTR